MYDELKTTDAEILSQIKMEYQLWFDYVLPRRTRYRARLLKWLPSAKNEWKININMIANAIDVKIAQSFTNGVKAKFISRTGWIGEEEASNQTAVAEFDTTEPAFQQIKYQIYQDSEFFGAGICNRIGWDKIEHKNQYRVISPLSCIPDPLPTQTGQFDGQNYRFWGFNMRSYVQDMRKKYWDENINQYFYQRYSDTTEDQLTRDA